MDDFWSTSFPDGSNNFASQTQYGQGTGSMTIDAMATSARAQCSQQMPLAAEGTRRAKKTTSTKKLPNFSIQEDQILVSCWINVSTDPVVAIGQRKDSFWKSIEKSYNRLRVSYPERSQKSLVNRWDYINKAVSKFAGYLEQVHCANRSGHTDADKVSLLLPSFSFGIKVMTP